MLKESDIHHYQHRAIDHVIDNPFCFLALDMGLGKTVATLTAIKKLMFEYIEVRRVLVIAPKRVAENVWTSEIDEWEHLEGIATSKITGTEKERKAALAMRAHVYIISRDNVAWLCGQYGGSSLPFDMLVIDESSSFKNSKSQRFKALRHVQTSFNRIVLLSGTPAPNSLIDLWAQIFLLDRGERLGRFISNFRSNYFTPGQRNGAVVFNYKIQKDGEKRIYDKIGDICMSMKKEDYLELPGVVVKDIPIVFPPELQAKYDEFEKENILELIGSQGDEVEIPAVNAAALSNKLLQFAGGAIYDEDKNWHEVHTLKLDALEERIEALNSKPVLIAWAFRHERDRIAKRLKKYKPRELKTNKDISDWNAGKIQVLLMHPASGGHGLNLQKGGDRIIWFGPTWSLELYLQLNTRIDRQGKEGITFIDRLIAKETMDTEVVKALTRKNAGQEGLLLAIKARVEKYKKLF